MHRRTGHQPCKIVQRSGGGFVKLAAGKKNGNFYGAQPVGSVVIFTGTINSELARPPHVGVDCAVHLLKCLHKRFGVRLNSAEVSAVEFCNRKLVFRIRVIFRCFAPVNSLPHILWQLVYITPLVLKPARSTDERG